MFHENYQWIITELCIRNICFNEARLAAIKYKKYQSNDIMILRITDYKKKNKYIFLITRHFRVNSVSILV